MRAFSILSLLTATMASVAFGCKQRNTACSPEDVCNTLSGVSVCGTRERADGPCQTTINAPRATNPALSGSGTVTCNCCPV
ncbi:hypothetical protein LX32DRAFT_292896 [Colletotrichum zoysiae]|uniref:Uncharacterized protein n=1 Tax=Colletotrichum zoysiae TaxID=1216348 RepID=A0AAD9HL96_9PEZI|nr:hypothetical protein LX32DRAFT_292896 [Colletotrichum zoysiae]